jgi:hypothetical protein
VKACLSMPRRKEGQCSILLDPSSQPPMQRKMVYAHLVQLLQSLKLRREPAFRRRVHHEHDFAIELVQIIGSALLCGAAALD